MFSTDKGQPNTTKSATNSHTIATDRSKHHHLDRERLRRLAEESQSWPAYMRAPLGVEAPSRWLPIREGGAR